MGSVILLRKMREESMGSRAVFKQNGITTHAKKSQKVCQNNQDVDHGMLFEASIDSVQIYGTVVEISRYTLCCCSSLE
jgi:hypothetical protein